MKKIDNQRRATPPIAPAAKELSPVESKKMGAKFRSILREKGTSGSGDTAGAESADAAPQEPQLEAKLEVQARSTTSGGVGGKADVPDSWKFPEGPYHQAPAEYGGGWWQVSPFTGSEPWKNAALQAQRKADGTAATAQKQDSYPDGFLEAFPKPERSQYKSATEFRGAMGRWETDLKYFKQVGTPPGVSEAQINAASDIARQWGLGTPQIYEGRYGWAVRYPESQFPTFETNLNGLMNNIQQTVAQYQVKLIRSGVEPVTRHPMVPPHVKVKTDA